VAASTQRRAIVIGGSMSGLFAALMLRRRGWQVDVYERVDGELAGRGAGIVAQPEIRRAFETLGIDFGETLGVSTIERRTFEQDGTLAAKIDCPQIHTTWERVYRLLRDALPAEHFHRGVRFTHVEQTAEGVTAHFDGGRTAEGDLLVGADGLRSTVRTQFIPDQQPLYPGYVAWRAMIDEAAMSPRTHADIYLCMAFCLPEHEQMLGYPVAGPNDDLRPGHRRYNVVWYRPTDERRLEWMLTDEAGVTHAGSIPPPLIHKSVIAEMRKDALRLLSPQFQEVIGHAEQPFLQPIYDFETPHMVFGRIAILGDAAFVARPHVGAGVAKAADDATALADALAANESIEDALKQFEAARTAVGRRIVERGRALGAYMQCERRTDWERTVAQRHHGPYPTMQETALLDFLYV
jgi:2-polyprenyl-6-methoxyphenol hydroxylase-like FAD-dependent oxidoreductase